MIILTGKSGSGKSSVIRALSETGRFNRIVTCTTRPMRAGEADGRDYYFMDENTFREMEKAGRFAETACTGGYSYGSLKESYKDPRGVVVLDPSGVRSVHDAIGKERVTVFFLDAPTTLLRKRITKRGDGLRSAVSRLAEDEARFEGFDLYDFRIQQSEKTSVDEIADLISWIGLDNLGEQKGRNR